VTQDSKAEFLAKAQADPQELKVIDLLAIWGYLARSYEAVSTIRQDLKNAGLGCEPGFSEAGRETVVLVGAGLGASQATGDADRDPGDLPLQLPLNPMLVRDVPSWNRPVVRVPPEFSIAQAQARMAQNDCSLLAVMSSDRDLIGAVSWELIAKARARNAVGLQNAMLVPAPVARCDEELLGSIHMIEKYGFFFVRETDDRVCGLVTVADLAAAYRRLTTPYFQLGEIERRLRHCINTHFSTEQMRAAVSRNKNRINSADDMEFGQYKEVLGNDARWEDLDFGFDQVTIIDQLDEARKVRNKIMHFGKELTPEEQAQLERCLRLMRHLDDQQ
jgi:CBS domain-containing protein